MYLKRKLIKVLNFEQVFKVCHIYLDFIGYAILYTVLCICLLLQISIPCLIQMSVLKLFLTKNNNFTPNIKKNKK